MVIGGTTDVLCALRLGRSAGAAENVSINYGLYFHSNLSAGQDRLETDGASSILKKKKQ